MADIVPSLFGLTPEMYGEQQRRSALQEGITLAQLDPSARGTAMTYAGARNFGNAFGGAMGVQDPQLQLISIRNSIQQQIDQTNPESILKGAQMLAQAGDQQGAMALAQYARQAQSEMAQTEQRLAAGKASLAQAARERVQAATPAIQEANEMATLQDTLDQLKAQPVSPERDRAINMITTRFVQLERLTNKKETAANVKEVGVAEGTREPVYLDVNNDQQFIFKTGADGKQMRVPYAGGVDRTTAKTMVSVSQKQEEKFAEKRGTTQADALATASAAASSGVKALNTLTSMKKLDASGELFTGPLANSYIGATNLLASVGLLSPAQIKNLASSEIYDKQAKDLVMEDLGGKLGAQISDADRKFVEARIPQITTSQKARTELLDKLSEIQKGKVDYWRKMNAHANKYNNLNEFDFSEVYSPVPTVPTATPSGAWSAKPVKS
jgi:hypothetical protein